MKLLACIMIIATCSTNKILAENSNVLKVNEYKLENGLTVWLNEDHSQPKIFGAVIVKAGSKDCPDTGIAHYFEHMMFKGTDKIGTTNYAAEKEILDVISQKYDELASTTDLKQRAQLLKSINELTVSSSKYVIPNEFNRLITRYGGSGLNAATSYDATIYFNTFSPQYIEQWAELNSERLIDPVFRLFQNELETVYEEKNMHGDMIGGQVMDTLLSRYFKPHPYAFPIIGSTKNLKNPRLSEMHKFFNDYYVASNMALILSGDFDTEAIMPIIKNTFSRIRSGVAPVRKSVSLPPFKGKEKMKVKFPIPFLKAIGLGFRGVPANHEDLVTLKIAISLLNNTNGTGFLDKLMIDHKLLGAVAMNENLNEAGILAVAAITKPIIQTYGNAEKMIWKQINRIKQGDFSDEIFNSMKLEQKRQFASALENIDSRTTIMMNLFSQGKSWNDYLREVSKIDAITKEDVIRVTNKYFTKNYLYITKSTGKYPKDDLPKPDFAPVIPKNIEASSEYAKYLATIPVQPSKPRLIDFDKDVKTFQLTPLVRLYITPNKMNDIFTIDIIYNVGFNKMPILTQLAMYLQFLGTDTLVYEQFRSKLQTIGSTLMFDVSNNFFVVKISGFDNHIKETMTLVNDFMRHVKADDKKVHQLSDEDKVTRKAFYKSSDNVASALLEKVRYGNNSKYLTKLTHSQVKNLKGKQLLEAFHTVQKVQCSIHYCGTLPDDEITTIIKNNVAIDDVKNESQLFSPKVLKYDRPSVFFVNMPEVSQSIIYSYVISKPQTDIRERNASQMFSVYFGGGMSSLMFQEIREFRSFAYRANGSFLLSPYLFRNQPGHFVTMLSTQSDKTIDAMTLLDSLIKKMPIKPEKVASVKQNIINQVNNEYPPYRTLSSKIDEFRREGFTSDPRQFLLENIREMDMNDINCFYEENVSGRPVIYIIAGNKKKIDMEKLASFGTIINVKKKDIYN